MERTYTKCQVMEYLNIMDDYDRTDTDYEQDSIKIAKFVISNLPSNVKFRINEGYIIQAY